MTGITIFTGAGASYSSGYTTPYNSPLGRSLYSELEKYAPQLMSQISAIVGTENTTNFEMKMHEIWKSRRINGIVLNAMVASYFSRFRPGSFGNYYVELFRNLNLENVDYVYSTLNYDCLAELAASSVGMTINYNLDLMPSSQFDVLKLHGSCNFLLKGITGQLGSISTSVGGGIIDGSIEVVQPAQVSTLIQNRPAGPCISFYMKNKPTAVGTKTIQAIQKKWKEIIQYSDTLVIIGANVNKEDKHIWEPISNSKANIGFVGSSNAFTILQSLNSNINATHLSTDFSSSITSIIQFVS